MHTRAGPTSTDKHEVSAIVFVKPRLRLDYVLLHAESGVDFFSSRWQYNQCLYPKPHSLRLERPVARSTSNTEIKLPTAVR